MLNQSCFELCRDGEIEENITCLVQVLSQKRSASTTARVLVSTSVDLAFSDTRMSPKGRPSFFQHTPSRS